MTAAAPIAKTSMTNLCGRLRTATTENCAPLTPATVPYAYWRESCPTVVGSASAAPGTNSSARKASYEKSGKTRIQPDA